MKILVTGGTGMVGRGFLNVDSSHDIKLVGSKDYDLSDYQSACKMIQENLPDAIIHLAARVGGVKSNTDFVADFYHQNVMINSNVLQAAHVNGVEKLVSLLSTCVYPDKVSYPLTEDQIHNGRPHKSNFGYAYAKRMLDVHSRALRQQYGRNYICAVPNNLYGPGDYFDLENCHVLPAIIRKVYEAKALGKEVVLWGDGSPLREFTFSGDIAKVLLFLLENYTGEMPINIGQTGEQTISEVTQKICTIMDYDYNMIRWDMTKPAGQYKKPSSNDELKRLGWCIDDYTPIEDGLLKTCRWFEKQYPRIRGY